MNTHQQVRALLCAALLNVSIVGIGQEAPTGFHYAARAADSGAGGNSISAAGDFTGLVPLQLPPERTGTPIPLQVLYATHGLGAAGLGWDIPLSYIQRDQTLAHRRPINTGSALLAD